MSSFKTGGKISPNKTGTNHLRCRLKPDYSVVGTLFPRPTSHTGEVRKEHKKD